MNRGLTRQQAEDGVIPEPLTQAEWQALHDAALIEEGEALQRTFDARVKAEVRADEQRDERQQAVEFRPLTAQDHIAALEALGAKKIPRVVAIEDTTWKTVYTARQGRTVLVLTEEMDT